MRAGTVFVAIVKDGVEDKDAETGTDRTKNNSPRQRNTCGLVSSSMTR